MALINITIKGEGKIDNAVTFLEDPLRTTPYYLKPESEKEWKIEGISIPIEGELDYSIHVLAYTGTKFTCTIESATGGKIEIEGVTGKHIKSRADINGAQIIS